MHPFGITLSDRCSCSHLTSPTCDSSAVPAVYDDPPTQTVPTIYKSFVSLPQSDEMKIFSMPSTWRSKTETSTSVMPLPLAALFEQPIQ